MNRDLGLFLNWVSPTPASLRDVPAVDRPCSTVTVNLGQLYQHYYYDSFPTGPPAPDPSRFEYLDYLAPSSEFRFLSYVSDASVTKKRGMSTDLGQAFCRWSLDAHFGIKYFAHMLRVLDRSTHPGFDGLRIERAARGDTPDYLCARSVSRPFIAEAKGRFSSISFGSAEFAQWRSQFSRIRIRDRRGALIKVKGYIVGTRFVTESNVRANPGLYIEDPETPGDASFEDDLGQGLGRVIAAFHYAQVLRKMDLHLIAAALENGGGLASELRFQVPVWTCLGPPLAGEEFIGGFYQTRAGRLPVLTGKGWQMPIELGQGHAVFVGLKRSIAVEVSRAARGELSALDQLPELRPEGAWSSEFSWLPDGTVLAPLDYFAPSGIQQL